MEKKIKSNEKSAQDTRYFPYIGSKSLKNLRVVLVETNPILSLTGNIGFYYNKNRIQPFLSVLKR